MARFIIEGISMAQAEELADWYEGQGEQDAGVWFETRDDGLKAPMSDCGRKGGCTKVDGDAQDVTLYCK